MPAPIIEFVDVNVLVGGVSVDKFSFGTLMGVFEHDVTPERQSGPYFSLQEVNDAGFTSTANPDVNAWATAVFSQDDGVDSLLIGRRTPALGHFVSAAWQVQDFGGVFVDLTPEANDDTPADVPVFPSPDTVADYFAVGSAEVFETVTVVSGTLGVGGICSWQYWDGFSWANIPGVVDGTTNLTAAGTQEVTFSAPGDWAPVSLNGTPPLYYVRAQNDGGYTTIPIISRVYLGDGDATWTATMDAIETAGPNDWYITNIESREDVALGEVATWTESRKKIFLGQSSDLTVAAFLAWQGLGYNRSSGWYHALDAEYLEGGESSSGGGLNLDAPDGAGIWAYRQLEGVTFDAVTGAEALAIYAADANLFGRNKGVNFTSKGTMASGRFIDVTTSIDWTVTRMEEAILALFVGTPTKIPYTNAGINIIVATVQDVLNRGVTAGHFSTDVAPTVVAPDVSTVSSQDKIDRVLTLTANVVLAGAIQKVVLNINLTF